MTKATRKDWASWKKSAGPVRRVSCCFAFTEDQYRLIEEGRISESFDDPWNIVEENGVLSFYRSRTSIFVYEAVFVRQGGHRVVREIRATTDLEAYPVPENDHAVAADVWHVIDVFLLRTPIDAKGADSIKPLDRYAAGALTCEKIGLSGHKIARGDLSGLADLPLDRTAVCGLTYTGEEYERIRLGLISDEIDDAYWIYEENNRLFFVDRARKNVEFVAVFEPQGSWWVIRNVLLKDDEAGRRSIYPRDVDAAARVWMIIERLLLRRFPEKEWQDYMESFRLTPELDDPAVPKGIYERWLLFAQSTFFARHARMLRAPSWNLSRSLDEALQHRFHALEDGRLAYYPKGLLGPGFVIAPESAALLRMRLKGINILGLGLMVLGTLILPGVLFKDDSSYIESMLISGALATALSVALEKFVSRAPRGAEPVTVKPYSLKEFFHWAFVEKGSPVALLGIFGLLPNWSAASRLWRQEGLTWRAVLEPIAAARGRRKNLALLAAATAYLVILPFSPGALALGFGSRHWPAILAVEVIAVVFGAALWIEYAILAWLSPRNVVKQRLKPDQE